MLDGLKETFGETFEAITATNERIIGIFIIPLLIVIFMTAAQFTILVNSSHQTIFQALDSSGVCNTYQPYLITSMLGTFQNDPLVHIGMCQASSFNILVFIAWYGEMFLLLLIVIIIFEAITHLG